MKWNFYLKIDFKIQTCLFTVPPSLPTDPKVLILMNMWDAGACAFALASASLLAKPMLLAKNGDFLGVLIYARRDSLVENRGM